MINDLINPKPQDALNFIKKHHVSTANKTFLLIIGDCIIDYKGRARSILDWGERVIMIKQDSTLIVHQPEMREPVNWQPSGSKTSFKVNDNQLILRSHHSKPPEKMNIIFRKIFLIAVTSLRDKAKLIISGMEIDVVNQIINNPGIIEEGLRVSKREKKVKSGKIDIFCYDKNHTPLIIEVKRSLATISAVHQLRVYVSEVKKDVKNANVRGMLCAPRIPDMVKKLLSDYGLEWKEVQRRVVLHDDYQKTLKNF